MGAGVILAKTLSSVVVASDDTVTMLAELAARPADHELRRRAAEALDDAGRHGEAITVLAPLINLTGHDDDVELPCLCKRCLPAAGETASAHDLQFVRSFAVAGTRVLHFWMLAEQQRERAKVRASVSSALGERLAAQKGRG
jgi:hypothetical protein